MASATPFVNVHIVLAVLCHGASAASSASEAQVGSNNFAGFFADWGFPAPETLKDMFANKCTGNDNPPGNPPYCFSGWKLGETVTVKVSSFDADKGAGHLKFVGSGVSKIRCGSDFTKSDQMILFRKECIPTGIEQMDAKYCSEQNSVLLRGTVQTIGAGTEMVLKQVDCPAGNLESARSSLLRSRSKRSVGILASGDVDAEFDE